MPVGTGQRPAKNLLAKQAPELRELANRLRFGEVAPPGASAPRVATYAEIRTALQAQGAPAIPDGAMTAYFKSRAYRTWCRDRVRAQDEGKQARAVWDALKGDGNPLANLADLTQYEAVLALRRELKGGEADPARIAQALAGVQRACAAAADAETDRRLAAKDARIAELEAQLAEARQERDGGVAGKGGISPEGRQAVEEALRAL